MREETAMQDQAFVFPASYAQQRLWFLDQLVPGNAFYNVPATLRLTTPLDVEALRQSLGEIVRRHETLRTTFAVVDGQPMQVIAPQLEVELPVTDLRHLPGAERSREATRLAAQEAQRPFDLARGPLLRAGLLRLGEADHLLLLTVHHIVADGWSMGILFRELAALYTAVAAGRPSPLPELPIQYADYAYWRQQLAELPVQALPTDRPRPAATSFRGARQVLTLPAGLSAALKALSQRE